MNKGILLLVLMCGVSTLWASNVFVANAEERVMPIDSAWGQIYDSLQVDNQQWAQQDFERLSAAYVEEGHYDYALFLTNEYGYWIRAKRRQGEAMELADSMIHLCESYLPHDHIELLYAYYNQAVSYGSNPLAYPWYSKFFTNYTDGVLVQQMFQARLYFGMSKLWKGKHHEAWSSWDHCLSSDLTAHQKVRLYNTIGVAVRATDLEVANALLEVAWHLANDKLSTDLVNRYKTINYLTIFTYLNEDYDKALSYALQGVDFLQGDGHSLFSYMTIPSDMHCIAAESAFCLDRFELGDSILSVIEAQAETFKDAVLIQAKLAQYRGMMYNEQALFDKAGASFELCIAENKKVFGEQGIDYNFCRPYADLATNYKNQQRYTEAIDLYEKAIKTMCPKSYDAIDQLFYFVNADSISSFYLADINSLLVEMMQVYRSRYEKEGTISYLREILKLSAYGNKLVKKWYSQVVNEETLMEAVALFKTNGNQALYAYSHLSEDGINYADSAFAIADLPRSFGLSNLKSMKSHGSSDKQDSLRTRINRLSVELMNAADLDKEEHLMLQLQLLRSKMILSELSSESKAVSSYEVDVKTFQQQIDDDKLILQYTVADSLVYITSCSSEQIKMYSVEFKTIEKKKKALLRALKTGGMHADSQELWYDKLIAPALRDLKGKKELVLYPDEQFSGIPFEAFVDRKGSFLIENYTISYHFSAKQQEDKSLGEQAMSTLLLAPGFMDQDFFLAEQVSDQTQRSAEIFVRQGERMTLAPLQYSLEEVAEVNALFNKEKLPVKEFVEHEATKSNFIQNASAFSIIHVATHGISKSAAETGLFFAKEPVGNDNFLHTNELYKLNLAADLVVISACKSAIGDVKVGEGVMALPRGFMYAGVPNVLASLWKVHDEKTKELMVSFYQALLKGNTYSEALRVAKLKAIKDHVLPVDWASFVLLHE